MKRAYMEPQMIVEDFSVSEMVAKNCRAPESAIRLVGHMSGSYDLCGWSHYEDTKWEHAYVEVSDFAEGYDFYKDWDKDLPGGDVGLDYLFTGAYNDKSNGSYVCDFDPGAHGIFFGEDTGIRCDDDSTLLYNS